MFGTKGLPQLGSPPMMQKLDELSLTSQCPTISGAEHKKHELCWIKKLPKAKDPSQSN